MPVRLGYHNHANLPLPLIVTPRQMTPYHASDLIKLVGIVSLYVLMAWFVQTFFGGNDLILFAWLAFGPATAAVYVFGNRLLPGVLVGTLLGFLLHTDLTGAVNGALRHTIVLWAGAWLLRRDKNFDPELGSLRDYQRIFTVSCALGLLAASVTVVMAWLGLALDTFTFVQFFAGAMLGNLIGVPLFLVWRKAPAHWANRQNVLYAIVILGLSWLVGQVVFLDWMKGTLGQIARGYWMFLFVTWAAVRLGPHGAVLVVASTAIQALVGAQFGTGFFSNDIARTHLSNYYFYMLSLSAVGMALASYFAQRQQAMQDMDAKMLELDRVNAELGRKNEEMESMIYTASHDLRSPLVNIQGFGQRLEKAIGDIHTRLAQADVPEKVRSDLARNLDERMPTALGFITSSSLKMDGLINGLLRLSRVGRAPMLVRPLNMNAMLRDIVGNLTIQTQQAGASIRVDPLPVCLGDATQINQVFTNLLDNAIKYRDPARPLQIRISGRSDGERAHYEVADNGVGIAENHQSKVWQIFQRLDPHGPVPGEGLGLTLVRRILERHNGHITLTSTLGIGSCFAIELPAATLIEDSP